MIVAGPVADQIVKTLDEIASFRMWRRGTIDRGSYVTELDHVMTSPLSASLSLNQRALSARMHWDGDHFVIRALSECVQTGLLPSDRYDVEGFRHFADLMRTSWRHDRRSTFIFPEEAQFLYALANILTPRRIIAAGSYYGYWAAWAIAGAGSALSEAVLLDVDAEVNAIAAANLDRTGLAARTRVLTVDAIGYLRDAQEGADLLIMDAEGPKQGATPRLLAKAIYGPIAEVALPNLQQGGLLIAHNILLDQMVDHDYFNALVKHNEAELAEFIDLTTANCPKRLRIPSTEGIGVYMK